MSLPTFTAPEIREVVFTWLDLIVERSRDDAPESFRRIAEVVPALKLAADKSNYLGRRFYLGQKHRTEPCPVHKGRWSGYAFPSRCACSLGSYDITGWLPEEGDETPSLGRCQMPGCDADATVDLATATKEVRSCSAHIDEMVREMTYG